MKKYSQPKADIIKMLTSEDILVASGDKDFGKDPYANDPLWIGL